MEEFNVILENVLNFLKTDGVTLARNISIILLFFMLIKTIIRGMKKAVNKNQNIEKTIPNFTISLLNIGLMAALVIFTLNSVFNVSTDSVVTIASVLTLGISLALQDTIAGLANGIIIVSTKPFVEGEYASFNGVEGTVVAVTMFNTVLKTFDGLMLTAPNSMITTNAVKNFSRLPTRRIDIDIPVSYQTDLELLKKVILNIANNTKGVLQDPAPACVLTSYGDSNLNYSLRVWVSGDIYWNVKFGLNEMIINALRENNISIDYTRYDVLIKNNDAKGGN